MSSDTLQLPSFNRHRLGFRIGIRFPASPGASAAHRCIETIEQAVYERFDELPEESLLRAPLLRENAVERERVSARRLHLRIPWSCHGSARACGKWHAGVFLFPDVDREGLPQRPAAMRAAPVECQERRRRSPWSPLRSEVDASGVSARG